MEESKQFGKRLRELRIQALLTQRQLAVRVGVDFSYLSKIETGILPPPSEKVILKLAEVLNADKDELITLAGKIPADIAQLLKYQKTLQLLRSERTQKKVMAKKGEGVSLIKDFKRLTKVAKPRIPVMYTNFARVAIAVILVIAIGTSLWFASPTKALEVDFASLPSGNIGTTHSFSVTVDIKDYELAPIQTINLEIYNVSDSSKTATLASLPLNSGSKNYSSAETGGGAASATAAPDAGWTYTSSGTGYIEWNATAYAFGPASGYSYSSGTGGITYAITWTSPSGWPTGNYKVKVDVNASSAARSETYTETSSAFSLTAAAAAQASGAGGEPAPEPAVGDVSDTIDEDGIFTESVTLESQDEQVSLLIPEDTTGLTAEGEPLSEISITAVVKPPELPEGSNLIGLNYDLGPSGATFDPPITITFTYNPAWIPAGADEEKLDIAFYDEDSGRWISLDAEDITIDTETNTISANISHFTYFSVIASVLPAELTVSDLTISPAEVNIAQYVTISASVTNSGNLPGSYQATLKIDDVVSSTKKVTVAAKSTEKVTFTVVKGTPGSYEVTINGLSGTFTVKPAPAVTVSPAPAPPAPTPAPAPPAPAPAPTPAPPAPAPAPSPPAAPAVNWWIIGVIAAVILIIAGVVVWFYGFRPEY